MYIIAGSNLFGQWLGDECIISSFQTISLKNNVQLDLRDAKLIHTNWSYNLFKKENCFYLSGSWRGKENQVVKLNLPEESYISDDNLTMVGNDYNLMLISTATHTMWIISLAPENNIKKININIETPLPCTVENATKKLRREDIILKAIATNSTLICLSSEGMVYCGLLPSHLNTSHCEGKVCDVQCGYEHYVILTDTGKVYTWGNGRRLQLGHGDLDNLETPTEIEALAGIKIVKISAGGWHSLALSEFGDVYAWGWNDTGQLGIKAEPENLKGQGVLKKEGLGSYPLPTLVYLFNENGQEINLDVKDIACGTRHSVILLEDNSVWTTGYNKYGQLGLPVEIHSNVSYFKKSFQCDEGFELKCGPWCTILTKAQENERKLN